MPLGISSRLINSILWRVQVGAPHLDPFLIGTLKNISVSRNPRAYLATM